ncbi:hypothetical protein A1QK_06550 [Vibrio genomosp. F10 str. 9ZD137]|nr:hypothetical protein A1QK_06550 [Vibrio genomosp. F10 str. 9ZD137]
MNNKENALVKLLGVIRKDNGINNITDAIEQLSLLLILKYLYDSLLILDSEPRRYRSFSDLFESFYYDSFDDNDFSMFQTALKALIIDSEYVYEKRLTESDLYKLEILFKNIPFKFKSKKVFDALISGIDHVKTSEDIAQDYDDLLSVMVNESSTSGAYYSPRALVKAIVKVTNPTAGNTIYDPALGTGSFIVESLDYLARNSIDLQRSYHYGRDISPFANLVSSLHILLKGYDINNIHLGDSLLYMDESGRKFDTVFVMPPFGKVASDEEYNYRIYGKTSSLELMFLKLSMKSLEIGGKSVIVVPDGALFNSSSEFLNVRKEILTEFNLHSILSLPTGALYPYSGVKASVLFFDNAKPCNDIWFYELSDNKSFGKKSQISEGDLVDFVERFSVRSEGFNSCLVSRQDILSRNDYNLCIELPRQKIKGNDFDVLSEVEHLKDESGKYHELISQFSNILEKTNGTEFGKKVTIGEIFKTKSGRKLSRSEVGDQGSVPVYGGNGIIGYYNDFNLEGENILIGRVGAHCGNVHYTTGPIWLTDNSFSVQLHTSMKIYLPYLAHVLRSLDLNSSARGSAQPSISYAKIKDIQIGLPSYEKQVDLAKWFDSMLEQKTELLRSLKVQTALLDKLTEKSIISHCVPLEFNKALNE